MSCLSVRSSFFNRLVLIAFVWQTICPTFVFADFTRTQPDAALIEIHNAQKYLRLMVGVQDLDATNKQEQNSLTDKIREFNFMVPIGIITQEDTQTYLNDFYKDSGYENIRIRDNGFSWSAYGLNFILQNDGTLCVSPNRDVLEPSRNILLFNAHGSILLQDNLSFDKLILDGKDAKQQGNLRTQNLISNLKGHLFNEGHTESQTLTLNGKSLVNTKTGTLTLAGAAELFCDKVQNDGALTFNGILKGSVNRFKNTGGLHTFGVSQLTGSKFTNEGIMNLHSAFLFDGKEFITTDDSTINSTQDFSVQTTRQLTLRGNITIAAQYNTDGSPQKKAHASFKAPSIEHHAKIRVEKGTTRLNGDVTNYGTLDMDALEHTGNTIINNGDLQANTLNTNKTLSLLRNTGSFIARSGAYTTIKTQNTKLLSLANGRYHVGIFENAEQATLSLHSGAHMFVKDIINNGLMSSRTHYILDSLRNMTKLGMVRADGDLIIKSTYIPTTAVPHTPEPAQSRNLSATASVAERVTEIDEN